ncbi:MAG: DHH family phosphoesterase [Lactobacillales bacterium]|jgi:c-di-AMP phosphodiesterase-like protein|nr:DHH family phosphoesterase [Lactobacillales bacterium]
MKKPTKTEILIFVLSVLIIEILGVYFFIPMWMKIVWLMAIGVAVYIFCWRMTQLLEMNDMEIIRYTNKYAEEATREVLDSMPVGVIRYNIETHERIWMNPYADYVYTGNDETLGRKEIQKFLNLDEEENHYVLLGEKQYYFYVYPNDGLIYFVDVTSEQSLKAKLQRQQLAIGTLSVDNYDDVTENMDEKEISILNSLITSLVTDWLREQEVYSRRLNSEKFFFVTNYGRLKSMMSNKFDLLDTFRTKMSENETPVTLSIGIAYGMSAAEVIGKVANNNLEIALVRGGDQVVVKEDVETSKPVYFGGKSASVVKRTRVRTRAMATALKGIIQDTEDVYVMGHRFPDMDAIGSAFGVAYLARQYGKTAYVVIDNRQLIPDVEKCLTELKNYPDLQEYILTPIEVLKRDQENSLLVMVDHSKPSLTMSQEVYERFDKVVVIDHHRRGDEFPANPLLSYIESGASSASELVTELIQYQDVTKNRLSKMEATLLLSGIVVDTKSFQMRTTSRTFDTASFLRSRGADSDMVQSLLSSDLNSYMEMNGLIGQSEYVTEDMVVAAAVDGKQYNSVTAAKAADTILSMSGIHASFVVTERTDGLIGISARSKGRINVQTIMEQMGGGGHFNNAAVQLKETTVAEVKKKLLTVIQQNINEIYERN